MTESKYTQITLAVMKAFALGYNDGRHIGVEQNPYSATTYADEYKAYADGYHEGSSDWGADA